MAQFLYFLPGHAEMFATDGQLIGAGLAGQLLGLPNRQGVLIHDGPGGVAGLLLAVTDDDDDDGFPLGYCATSQRWEPEVSPSGKPPRYWVGSWNANAPGPDDLLRLESLAGHPVVLGDGNIWTVPLARAFPDGCALPATLRMGPGGLERKVSPEYAALWAHACRVWDNPGLLTEDQKWPICRDVLAVNYRLGEAELNLLGILTSQNLDGVIAALVDLPTWWAMKGELASKKAQAEAGNGIPAGSPSNSGAPDSSPATPPPSPTSVG